MTQQPLPTAEPTAAEVLVRDPLTPVARKERLYLLAVSMIGIAMVRTGLVPSKIATFGIELDQPNRSALLFLLALVTIYFLVAFIVYAASDYIAQREALGAALEREDTRERHQAVATYMNTSEDDVRKRYSEDPATMLPDDAKAVLDGRITIKELLSEDDLAAIVVEGTENHVRLVALARLFFEFLLPVLVGGYAIYSLLARSLA